VEVVTAAPTQGLAYLARLAILESASIRLWDVIRIVKARRRLDIALIIRPSARATDLG
jgi:hypothetical protein